MKQGACGASAAAYTGRLTVSPSSVTRLFPRTM